MERKPRQKIKINASVDIIIGSELQCYETCQFIYEIPQLSFENRHYCYLVNAKLKGINGEIIKRHDRCIEFQYEN